MASTLNPYTLKFRDPNLEDTYRRQYAQWLRSQARVALVVGLLIYLGSGLVDLTLPNSDLPLIWTARAAAMSIALGCLAYTYTGAFERHNQFALSLSGLAAAGGLIAIQQPLGYAAASHYFPGLILAIFWTYLFLGIRFSSALLACLLIELAYNLALFAAYHPPLTVYIDHNFYLFSANIIGGFSSYILERQRRTLFQQQRAVDRERRLIEELALQDNLTGLANRRRLEQRLETLIGDAERRNTLCAGLFIDIDHFKPINDRYGHDAGDEVLQILAKRIVHALRSSDLVARLGGDEFFVVLNELREKRAAEVTARKLLASLQEPVTIQPDAQGSVQCQVSASIGITYFPFRGATPAEILRRADTAMYRVKNEGRNDFQVYRAEPDTV